MMVQAVFGFDRIRQIANQAAIQRSHAFAVGIFGLKYSSSEGRKTSRYQGNIRHVLSRTRQFATLALSRKIREVSSHHVDESGADLDLNAFAHSGKLI
jgi:hypothetical protein